MATEDLYQSTFMPIFQKAETRIKELVLVAFLLGKPLLPLRAQIEGVIAWAVSQVPQELHDKRAYLRGLKNKSEQFIHLYYKKPRETFQVARSELLQILPRDRKPPKLENPQQLYDVVKDRRTLWAEAKGSPNVTNYAKELKKTIEKLAEDPVTTYEEGKKPISLWQKAELDVRWKNQTQKLQDLRVQGVQYAWLSSHPNCSKRCQCFQGELVSLTKHAKNPQKRVDKKFNYNKSSFVVEELDGNKVYSLQDIMEVVGPYGYQNNIYSGFNCRHRLIPYTKEVYGPKEYSQEDITKEREIEAKMREMEREIRKLKTKEILYIKIGDVKTAKAYRSQWEALFSHYKSFCEKNGYAWYQYRCNVI